MKLTKVSHLFVTNAPDVLLPGVLYVSVEYSTVLHLCCCGCGDQIVTPLAPSRWSMTFDGKSISLDPSVGNWSSKCQSHYWISKNQVTWDRQFSREEIELVRNLPITASRIGEPSGTTTASDRRKIRGSIIERLLTWLRGSAS